MLPNPSPQQLSDFMEDPQGSAEEADKEAPRFH